GSPRRGMRLLGQRQIFSTMHMFYFLLFSRFSNALKECPDGHGGASIPPHLKYFPRSPQINALRKGVQLFATPVDCSRSGSSIHRILQARILEWDVLGGILITAVLIVLTYPAWTLIDRLDSASPLLPVCVLVVPFLLCYNYPVSDYYSPTRADTTTILAAGAGVTIGFWINRFFQLVSEPTESLPVVQNIPPLTTELLAVGLAKFTVGIVLILLVRQLVQKLSLQVLYSWFKVVTRNKEARRRLEIEVPYKFVTYTSVGICATTFVPMLHRFLGLL
ncbi:hypothetical protein FD754_009517, partial [Muntiacus muntjak]